MKKFFSLLSGAQVRLAPGKKSIPASEFSSLQTAAEIVQTVKEEALSFKKDVAQEAELTKEQAFREGFDEGLFSFNQHLAALDKELKELREEIQKKILPLALKAARKIVGEELKTHPDRIIDIVLSSLKAVTQHKKVTIFVHHDDLMAIESNRNKIKNIFEHIESLSLQERPDVERGGCIIVTEAGIVNAQIENQLRALEKAFATFEEK